MPTVFSRTALALLVLVSLTCMHVHAADSSITCPPANFNSVPDLNLEKYIAARWYSLKQTLASYQPKSELYCVFAKYEKLDPANIKKGVLVKNYANKNEVNGRPVQTSVSGPFGINITLVAIPASDTAPSSQLLVGPPMLAKLLPGNWRAMFSPYWVVAVGPSTDPTIGYDWAIVSTGPPKYTTDKGCTNTNPMGSYAKFRNQAQGSQEGGLWFLSRKPVDAAALDAMEKKAVELGFDTSKLLKVEQEGCTYHDAQ